MDIRKPEILQEKTPVDLPLPEVVNATVSSQSNIRSFAITGLFVLAVLYTFYFAADFVLPVALALLMSLLLLPLVGFLNKKARIPEAVGSALAIAALIVILAGLALIDLPTGRLLPAGPAKSLARDPRASDFPQCVLKTSWSHLGSGPAVDGLQSSIDHGCHLEGSRSATNSFQPNTPLFGETNCGNDFNLFSFGTPGSLSP